MGGKSKKPEFQVTDYYMSLHVGICSGLDALLGIDMGDKAAWRGEITEQSTIEINNPNFYGGAEKEGGIRGQIHFMPGDANQVVPAGIAERFGRTPSTMPGFRGFSSVFFVRKENLRGGFLLGSNTPYLKTIAIKGRRAPKGLNPLRAMIGPDANPAHIIYECLTNNDWGMGGGAQSTDQDSYNAAAETLYNESFGLTMLWMNQDIVENFVQEVLDHINAVQYVDPTTGLNTLKLIRNDYVSSELPLFDPSNCTLTDFQRKFWGETTNEIIVTYTDRESQKPATVTLQDLANITAQGGEIVSDGRNYYGVRDPDLAMSLCARDLRVAASPLSTATLITDRKNGWNLTPGKCIRVTYPERNLKEVVYRIGPIDYGKPGSGKIKLSLVEDIFSFDPSAYTSPAQTLWVDPAAAPSDIEYVRPITAPALFLKIFSDGSEEYPEAYAAVLAATNNEDAYNYDLYSEELQLDETLDFEYIESRPLVGRAYLSAPLPAEAESVVAEFANPTSENGLVSGGFLIIGDGEDAAQEIAAVRGQDSNGFILDRGVLDTVPRAWPEGTPIWAVDKSSRIIDRTLRSAGEVVTYQLLPRTSLGRLPFDDATEHVYTVDPRPHRPNRPGNVLVNGVAFGDVDAIGESSITVQWANRNRVLEENSIVKWTDGNVTPEAGQTTTISVLDLDRNVVNTINSLSGTLFDLDAADFGGLNAGIVRVTAKRDGIESLQGHEIQVQIANGGYGFDYGEDYGG